MNSFDAEMYIQRQKETLRRAAEQYVALERIHPERSRQGLYFVYRRVLSSIGSRLVKIGLRLQGELGQLPASAHIADSLGISPNNPCVEC